MLFQGYGPVFAICKIAALISRGPVITGSLSGGQSGCLGAFTGNASDPENGYPEILVRRSAI